MKLTHHLTGPGLEKFNESRRGNEEAAPQLRPPPEVGGRFLGTAVAADFSSTLNCLTDTLRPQR